MLQKMSRNAVFEKDEDLMCTELDWENWAESFMSFHKKLSKLSKELPRIASRMLADPRFVILKIITTGS